MSVRYWLGHSVPVAQVNTITVGGTAAAAQTYSVTINAKTITYTATGPDTNTTIATALYDLLVTAASTIPEFGEVTWANPSAGVITGTAATAGIPFTNTSASSGSGTLVTATTTNSAGPNHWDDVDNWSGNAIPVTGDSVYVRGNAKDILYGIDQNAVTLALLDFDSTYNGKVGLPDYSGNTAGTASYAQYRQTRLKIGATIINIGRGTGGGSGRIRLDTQAIQTTINLYGTGSPESVGVYCVDWIGTHASNKLVASRGSFSAAPRSGDVATLATVIIGSRGNPSSDVNVLLGDGVTLTDIKQNGGVCELRNGFETGVMTSGELTIGGTAGVSTSLDAQGGTVNYDTSGTLTDYHGGTDSLIDFSRVNVARTVTAAALDARSGLRDPGRTVTFGGSGLLVRCALSELSELNLGENNYYQRTAA